jgi:RHS repeat-associated protein
MTQLTITGSQPLNISYNFTAGQNNGKITSQTDNISGETVTYQYDSLNRLLSASSSQSWSETYGFDAFGNLLSKAQTGGAPTLSQSVYTTNNQIMGQTYDNNGNQLSSPLGSVTYDAENRLASAPGVQYAYDSRNKRIWRGTLSNGVLSQQVYFYGVDGQKLGTYTFTLGQYGQTNLPEMTNSTVLLATFFGRKRIGTFDRLGSAKYNQDGAAQSFYPYGEDRGTVQPNDSLKFATYTRDAATGLDYADQRYYASNFGRMTSADRTWYGTSSARPASWNRYSYVEGDPVNYNDPFGKYIPPPSPDPPPVPDPEPDPPDPDPGQPGTPPTPVKGGPRQCSGGTVLDGPGHCVSPVTAGKELAAQWLKTPSCANLFNTSGNGFNPQQVLMSLTTGGGSFTGPLGNQVRLFSFSYPVPSAVVGGFTYPNTTLNGLIGADIFLNTNINTSVDEEAETILEELGHAYMLADGSGGSSVVTDNPIQSLLGFGQTYTDPISGQQVSAGQYNFDLIMKNCDK